MQPERPVILVVEDQVLVRLMIAEELRDRGMNVLEASDAQEALSILSTGEPLHVLLTDIRMPGRIDGVGLARIAHERRPELKLIFTSSDLPDAATRALANGFFVKPYNLAALVRHVEVLLAHAGESPAESNVAL